MDWKTPTEQAAIGFIGYGAVSLASPSILHFTLSALSGALVGFGYWYFRPLPWKSYLSRIIPGAAERSKRIACVSVTPGLNFREVSTRAPIGQAFIRVQGMDKVQLFEKLNGKAIDHSTIPYHMRVILEQGRELEVPWDAIEPHLKAI